MEIAPHILQANEEPRYSAWVEVWYPEQLESTLAVDLEDNHE